MSLDLNVYVESIDDSIIPQWMQKMNDLDMECELHPEFSFKGHGGFVPFKIVLKNPVNKSLEGRELLSGFELYMAPYDYKEELEEIQPKKTFFQKLLGTKSPKVDIVNAEFDSVLENCKWMLIFNWGSHNSLELRMASLSSAIIAELTGGVCCYPADNIWFERKTIVEDTFREVQEYEKSLKPNEWKVHDFTSWK